MTRRRLAALVAVVLVPVAVLAIVLVSIFSGDGGDSSNSNEATTPGASVPRDGSGGTPDVAGGGKADTGGSGTLRGEPLHVLDRAETPGPLKAKVAPAASDGTLTLDDLKGTPVVLNVWRSSCTPCRAEARILQTEWARLGPKGVLILGLNVRDPTPAARRFRAQLDVSYPSVTDRDGKVAKGLGATNAPETFFISRKGKIVGHVVGAMSFAQAELGARAAQSGAEFGDDQGSGRTPLP
jgi:peroxiredoxin